MSKNRNARDSLEPEPMDCTNTGSDQEVGLLPQTIYWCMWRRLADLLMINYWFFIIIISRLCYLKKHSSEGYLLCTQVALQIRSCLFPLQTTSSVILNVQSRLHWLDWTSIFSYSKLSMTLVIATSSWAESARPTLTPLERRTPSGGNIHPIWCHSEAVCCGRCTYEQIN